MRRAILPASVLAIGAAVAIGFPASAAEPAGTAVAVTQSAIVKDQQGQHGLAVSGPIFSGDRINTNVSGQAQLQFRDQTKLVVGPSSSVVIDDFVFSGKSTASSVSINAAKGTLRFITGASPKPAYLIKTPSATIGVRGTNIDLSVVGSVTNFVLWEGAARICDKRNRCIDVRGACEVVVVPSENDAQQLARTATTARFVAENFRYAVSQDALRPEFRVTTTGCGGGAGQTNTGGAAGTPSGSGNGGHGGGD